MEREKEKNMMAGIRERGEREKKKRTENLLQGNRLILLQQIWK